MQVVIVQFGGRAFSTAPLSLDQWLWCLFLGAGVLVWGQCITTIPTKKIPKTFTWGSGSPEDLDAGGSLVEDTSRGSISQEVKRTGQILWIRGLTRLQTQVMAQYLKICMLCCDSCIFKTIPSMIPVVSLPKSCSRQCMNCFLKNGLLTVDFVIRNHLKGATHYLVLY